MAVANHYSLASLPYIPVLEKNTNSVLYPDRIRDIVLRDIPFVVITDDIAKITIMAIITSYMGESFSLNLHHICYSIFKDLFTRDPFS